MEVKGDEYNVLFVVEIVTHIDTEIYLIRHCLHLHTCEANFRVFIYTYGLGRFFMFDSPLIFSKIHLRRYFLMN